MPTPPSEPVNSPLPSPLPEGPYFVASRQDVLKAKLIQKTWVGENIVVWCDESGRVCVAESSCAHLSSDLGLAAGGTRGGRFVCPFHRYGNVNHVQPVSVDGPCLESRFDLRTTRAMARIATLSLDFCVTSRVFGLGYSFVETREHSIGIDTRLWVLATPVDGTPIDSSLVSQVREIRSPRRRIAGLRLFPPRLRAPIINKVAVYFQLRDVQQDVVIWSRKPYRSNLLLCRSDGEIMTYRAYCAQFYPDPHDAARLRSVAAVTQHTASRSRRRAPALGLPEVQSHSRASSDTHHTS